MAVRLPWATATISDQHVLIADRTRAATALAFGPPAADLIRTGDDVIFARGPDSLAEAVSRDRDDSNLKTARALRLKVPPPVQLRADRLID